MNQKNYTAFLCVILFFLGYAHPYAVLLSVPNSLGFFVLDKIGLWSPGTRWAENNTLLLLFCIFLPPAITAIVMSSAIVYLTFKFFDAKKEGWKIASCIAGAVVVIIVTCVNPNSMPISFHGYIGANY